MHACLDNQECSVFQDPIITFKLCSFALLHDIFKRLKQILYFNTLFFVAVCGGHLTMDEGHLESPNYPEDYQANKECIWILSVSESYQVALKFESFEVSF